MLNAGTPSASFPLSVKADQASRGEASEFCLSLVSQSSLPTNAGVEVENGHLTYAPVLRLKRKAAQAPGGADGAPSRGVPAGGSTRTAAAPPASSRAAAAAAAASYVAAFPAAGGWPCPGLGSAPRPRGLAPAPAGAVGRGPAVRAAAHDAPPPPPRPRPWDRPRPLKSERGLPGPGAGGERRWTGPRRIGGRRREPDPLPPSLRRLHLGWARRPWRARGTPGAVVSPPPRPEAGRGSAAGHAGTCSRREGGGAPSRSPRPLAERAEGGGARGGSAALQWLPACPASRCGAVTSSPAGAGPAHSL